MAYPRAHDVASQATHSIRCPRAEGPSIYWITLGLYWNYNCVLQDIWSYFSEMRNKSHWIQQRIYRLTVCNRGAFALPRRCWGSRSRPRVFRERITVISLWRHNSDPCDNEESIAAHSNAIPRAMGCVTIKGSKVIWIPYKENKGIRIPYKGNQVIRICRPRRLYQGQSIAGKVLDKYIYACTELMDDKCTDANYVAKEPTIRGPFYKLEFTSITDMQTT